LQTKKNRKNDNGKYLLQAATTTWAAREQVVAVESVKNNSPRV